MRPRLLASAIAALALGAASAAPAAAAPLPADLSQLPRPQIAITGAVQNDNYGIPYSDWEGRPVAENCDLDGDDRDDLVAGAIGYDSGHGRVFATRGGPELAGGIVTELAETVEINGFEDTKTYGTWVECAGDFDGDGFDDVVVSSEGRGGGQDVPVVYVVHGGNAFFAQDSIDVSASGAPVVPIESPAGQNFDFGSAVPVGDVDEDGMADLAFILPWAAAVYLVPGRDPSALTEPIDPTEEREVLTYTRAFPTTLNPVGDLDGDGHDELVIVNGEADSAAGPIQVVSGAVLADDTEPSFNLATEAPGERLLFRVSGLEDSAAGFAIAGVPDLNGDGRDELAVGSRWQYGDPTGEPGRPESYGQVHVVFGTTENDPVDLANLGSGGYAITGPEERSHFSSAIAVSPDLNSDGLADLLIGAPGAQNPAMAPANYAGRGYVIYGQTSTTPIHTAGLEPEQGAVLYGTHLQNRVGLNAAVVGDVDGNGLPELAFGGWSKNFTGKGELRILQLGELPLPPGPGPGPGPIDDPTPTPETKPASKSDPAPTPTPAPAKPSLKSLGKKLAVSKKGVVKVAKVSCPAGGGACKVTAPKRVAVKIAGEKFWAQVLAPKQLAAGKSDVVELKLGAAAVELLDGGKLAVSVPLRVVNAGGEAKG